MLVAMHMSLMIFVLMLGCRSRTASHVSREMWAGIMEFACIDNPSKLTTLPRAYTLDDHVEAARRFREELRKYCDRTVCAVCSMYRPRCNVSRHDLNTIPNLALLDAALPKTDELPRDALTTFEWGNVSYCLQPAACFPSDDSSKCAADVCTECFADLKAKRVPKMSLVSFDAGITWCYACFMGTIQYAR